MSGFGNFLGHVRLKVCGADMVAIKELVAHGKEVASDAERAAFVGSKFGGAENLFGTGASQLKKFKSTLETMEGFASDVEAICTVNDAFDRIDQWNAGKLSQRDAAKAYDELFGAFGVLAEKLPATCQISKILKEISITHFFINMHDIGASRMGENQQTSTGRAMHELMKTGAFRGDHHLSR